MTWTLEAKGPFLIENVPTLVLTFHCKRIFFFQMKTVDVPNSSIWNCHCHWGDVVMMLNLLLPGLECSARRKDMGSSVDDEEHGYTQADIDQLERNEPFSMVLLLQRYNDRNSDGKWSMLAMTQITHMTGTEKEKFDTSKNCIPFDMTFEKKVMLPSMFLPLWIFLTLPNNLC